MRLAISLLLGAVIAGLLFLLMQDMITVDSDAQVAPPERTAIDFRRVDRDEHVETIDRTAPEPPEPREMPPTEEITHSTTESRTTPVDLPELPTLDGTGGPIPTGPTASGGEGRDGDAVPIVRIEPQWPREALMHGIEGWVKVRFTILPDGSVSNARVIESEPGRLFDRHALRAVSRWQFRPRVVDGRPVERTATQVIDFSLENR